MPPAQPILAVGERQLCVGKATHASGRDWGVPGGFSGLSICLWLVTFQEFLEMPGQAPAH